MKLVKQVIPGQLKLPIGSCIQVLTCGEEPNPRGVVVDYSYHPELGYVYVIMAIKSEALMRLTENEVRRLELVVDPVV